MDTVGIEGSLSLRKLGRVKTVEVSEVAEIAGAAEVAKVVEVAKVAEIVAEEPMRVGDRSEEVAAMGIVTRTAR